MVADPLGLVSPLAAWNIDDHSDSRTYCPCKCDPSYYSITLPEGHGSEERLTDVAWSYREPYPYVARIANHIAFYTDRVEVVVDGTASSSGTG